MSDIKNEVISEMVDGEHIQDHMLDHLINDREKQGIWYRYHLIGDCLRGNLSEPMIQNVSGKVKTSLDSEPVVLAPQRSKRLAIKPIAGFAIAASVAMVAVFSVQKGNETGLSAPASVVAANEQTKTVSSSSFVFDNTQVLPVVAKQSDSLDEVANQRLNNYLVNHNEYRSNGSINGILPYVRIRNH